MELRGALCCQRKDSGVTTQVDRYGSPVAAGPLGSRTGWRPGEVMTPSLFTDHKLKAGTNTKRALLEVYNMMSREVNQFKDTWNRTRHVIIIMTDGKTGFSPA